MHPSFWDVNMWGRRRVYCTAKGKQWHLIGVCHNITWNKPHKKNGRNLTSLYIKQYLDCHLLGLRKSHVTVGDDGGLPWSGSGESPVLLEACWGHPSRLAPDSGVPKDRSIHIASSETFDETCGTNEWWYMYIWDIMRLFSKDFLGCGSWFPFLLGRLHANGTKHGGSNAR